MRIDERDRTLEDPDPADDPGLYAEQDEHELEDCGGTCSGCREEIDYWED